MIDVSELMNDPDFSTEYTMIRSIGQWRDGRFILKKENEIVYYGPVQPATEKELEQLDTGDRNKITMKFMCAYPNEIFLTQEEEENETRTKKRACMTLSNHPSHSPFQSF